MKLFIAALFVFFVNLSFGQISSRPQIDKDIILADDLSAKGKKDESIKIYKKIIEDSKQISYSVGILEASIGIANILINHDEIREGDRYLKIAQNENLILKSRYYDDLINAILGNKFAGVGLYAESINAYKKNLKSSAYVSGASSANIATAFEKLFMLDSSLFYAKHAYQILVKEKRTPGISRGLATVSANIALVYLHMKGSLDSGRLYLNKAKLQADKDGMAAEWLAINKGAGLIAVKTRKVDSGIFYFQKALAIAKNNKDSEHIKDLYVKLGSVYELKKHHLQYVEYMKQYEHYSDSLEKLDNLPFVVQSMMKENEAVLRQEQKVETRRLIIFISLGVGVIALFIYFRIRRYRKKHRQIVEEIDELLDSVTVQKTEQEIEALGILLELAKAKDPAFFIKFNELNPEFKDKLLKKYPNLSLNDVEFCAYLRMNFDTKEIAIYANMSVRSVEAKKYRIRKKMGISSTDNINMQVMDI